MIHKVNTVQYTGNTKKINWKIKKKINWDCKVRIKIRKIGENGTIPIEEWNWVDFGSVGVMNISDNGNSCA